MFDNFSVLQRNWSKYRIFTEVFWQKLCKQTQLSKNRPSLWPCNGLIEFWNKGSKNSYVNNTGR